MEPASPSEEAAFWYQYYFHSERGRQGLIKDRRGIAWLLWRMWSPTWSFDEATFERTAKAFDNPDFVEVVIHSYRHRYGLVPGDPAYAGIEAALAAQPSIRVPAITIDGDADGVNPGTGATQRNSPPRTSIGFFRAPGTICLRSGRASGRRQFSTRGG